MRDSAAVNGSRSARWFWSFFRSHRNYMSHKRLRPECRVQNSWEVFCCVIEVETRVQSAELLGEFFIVLLRLTIRCALFGEYVDEVHHFLCSSYMEQPVVVI
ncbi:uncharacterized protein LOC107639328 isoform X3 [Arachis ipaensis]|uniref:uncharacterized protein LOC107639328 isoform X3 n=1 Tax=Arachis ipaensis TaxID=130454 RepID=UPI000A2B1C3D|nr:uncharacterized protein LOC107639328 isoform X3 [Arachis ipaensis]